jgi:hypothetical protein
MSLFTSVATNQKLFNHLQGVEIFCWMTSAFARLRRDKHYDLWADFFCAFRPLPHVGYGAASQRIQKTGS